MNTEENSDSSNTLREYDRMDPMAFIEDIFFISSKTGHGFKGVISYLK